MKRVITSVNGSQRRVGWVVDQKSHDKSHFLKRVALSYGPDGGGGVGLRLSGSPVLLFSGGSEGKVAHTRTYATQCIITLQVHYKRS